MSALSVLCVNGSPRAGRTTSQSFCEVWTETMQKNGANVSSIALRNSLRSDEGREALFVALDAAEVIFLALPLYVDSVPSIVVEAFEIIAEDGRLRASARRRRLVCVVNAGFPEAWHCELAIRVCEHFAEEVGLEWAGGMAVAQGAIINGKPLREVPNAHRLVHAVEGAAEDVFAGRPVSGRSLVEAALPMMPIWYYRAFANFSFVRKAVKGGSLWRLWDRPFDRTE